MNSDIIEFLVLTFPLNKPIKTNIHTLTTIDCIYLSVYDSQDFVGKSFIRGFGAMPYQEITKSIKKIKKLILNKEVLTSPELWKQFWHSYKLKASLADTYALAALDIAIWDLYAKKEKKTLLQLLNIDPIKIPTYGTTGWLSLSEDELVKECMDYKAYGINAFKVRLGHKYDYQRVKIIRELMGEEYTIMLDANQRYNVSEALQIAKKMADLNITWFEEPCGNSLQDLFNITQQSPIPIAVGENILDKKSFHDICKSKAAPILQLDILRCGGITGFIDIAKMINKHNIKLCNHLLPELSISLLSMFNSGYFLEYDNILPSNIFTQDFIIKNGILDTPFTIGTGVDLLPSVIENFRILEKI